MTPAPGMPLAELQATLAALQGQCPQFDPPRLRGVESLLERAQQQRPSVQAPLLRRAASMLADYRRDCEQFSEQPSRLAGVLATHRQQLATRRGGAASALRALQAQLNRDTPDDAASDGASSPISALLRQQEFSLLGASQSHAPDKATSEPPKELRALRQLRSRQRHQDIEQRIDQLKEKERKDKKRFAKARKKLSVYKVIYQDKRLTKFGLMEAPFSILRRVIFVGSAFIFDTGSAVYLAVVIFMLLSYLKLLYLIAV